MSEKSPNKDIEKSKPETSSGESENRRSSDSRERKMARAAMMEGEKVRKKDDRAGELLKLNSPAIDIVRDHFPEDISPKEHFEHDNGPNPLQTEEDFKKTFDLFLQQELVPVLDTNGKYRLDLQDIPYKETVRTYLDITKDTIKNLAGEGKDKKLPRTDVAIYLDKSARPVSWFVDELWKDITEEPQPRTEHLAIDRRAWFDHFRVNIGYGEYLSDSDDLAGWKDIPIHDVKEEEIASLLRLLNEEIVSHDELKKLIGGKDLQPVINRIKYRILEKEGINKLVEDGVIKTSAEFKKRSEPIFKEKKIDMLEGSKLKQIDEAMRIAAQLRGLFVPGGLSEEDLEHPEHIMKYPVDMEGKNITIIDEVVRTGATGEIAKHFIRWAFPEAAEVNFYVFYKPKVLTDADSSLNNQMLKIPFWYSLRHDDGTGRGILNPNRRYYEDRFANTPTDILRAAVYGADFLATPLDYETEIDKKSLRLRGQIANLRVAFEKGYI